MGSQVGGVLRQQQGRRTHCCVALPLLPESKCLQEKLLSEDCEWYVETFQASSCGQLPHTHPLEALRNSC